MDQELQFSQVQKHGFSYAHFLYTHLLQLAAPQLEQKLNDFILENPFLEISPRLKEEVSLSSLSNDKEYKHSLLDEDKFDDDHFEWQPTHERTLSDILIEQLELHNLSSKEMLIAKEIIGSLDSDGYMSSNISVIQGSLKKLNLRADPKEILAVLKIIWFLDPPSIGARNLQERLAIQLHKKLTHETNIKEKRLINAALSIITKHFELLKKRRFDKIMEKLAFDQENIESAFAIIQDLNPHPASNFSLKPNVIIPDFFVSPSSKNPKDLIILLNDKQTPPVKLSRSYITLFKSQNPKEESYNFFRKKYNDAKAMLNAINLRKETLLKVITEIAEQQKAFFLTGKDELKPLSQKAIASLTGFNTSTISRTVNNKYVSTPHGTFELSYFFSSSIKTKENENVSSKTIKNLIKSLVQNEDKNPLTDMQIAKKLQQKGYHIARRTVAKYRDSLGIPVARLRHSI